MMIQVGLFEDLHFFSLSTFIKIYKFKIEIGDTIFLNGTRVSTIMDNQHLRISVGYMVPIKI